MSAVSSYLYFRKFKYNYIHYKNAEEVLAVFESNRTDFDAFAEILDKTRVIQKLDERYLTQKKITYPTGDSMSNPKKQLYNFNVVSEEQYNYICSFYDENGPYSTDVLNNCYRTLFITEEDDVYICKKADGQGEGVDPFYSTKEDFVYLTDGWYYEIIEH